MTIQTLTLLFWISVVVGMPLGIVLTVLWAWRIRHRLKIIVETPNVHYSELALKAMFFMLPGMAAFFVLSLPALYLGHQVKQHGYCQRLVSVNDISAPDNPLFSERCGQFVFSDFSGED